MRTSCALVVALACPTAAAQPCPGATASPRGTMGEVWRQPMGSGTGGLILDAAPGLVVAGLQGGRTVSIDVESGAVCAVLVDAPGTKAPPSTVIDPYTARSRVAHGLLVGGGKNGIGAVELSSGKQLWVYALAVGDDHGLRDSLAVVATKAALAVSFRTHRTVGSNFKFDEIVAGLDPRTGRELWRLVAADHAPGVSQPTEGTVRIAGDGARVLVRTPGELRALDGTTGAQLWSTKWTPAAAVVGPRMPWMEAPRVASDGTYVALAFPDRIKIVEASKGAPVREVGVAGMATEVVMRAGAVYAALEAAPGKASVVAIDAASGVVTWSHAVAQSLTRLRVDHEHVYVVDGNARLWAYALADGAPRFGMNAGAFDFAIARTRGGVLRVAVPGVDIVAYEPPLVAPPPLASYARWELERRGDDCHPKAIVWTDGNDKDVWRRETPKRLQAISVGRCTESEAMYYLRNPRSNAHLLYAIFGVVDTGPLLVEGDVTGVLVLRKSDGAVVLDADAPRGTDALFFDDGTFTLTGLPGCTGRSRSAQVFHRCGDKLVYFNSQVAMVIAVDVRTGAASVEARAAYTKAALVKGGVKTEAAFAVGKYRLELNGVTYMH